MNPDHRSLCPINLALEVIGDRWSLLIIRDLIFARRRHFRELLALDERISSNILADRLSSLVGQGILTKSDDPTHKQKALYSLTEKGIDLLPVLLALSAWGRKHLPASEDHLARGAFLDEGGAPLARRMLSELRSDHLGRSGGGSSRQQSAIDAFLHAADPPTPRAQSRKRAVGANRSSARKEK